MFKPDTDYKRLAKKSNGLYSGYCAYIYPDGVSIWERRQVKDGKYKAEINVNHYWPCEIDLRSEDYTKDYGGGPMRCKCIVVRDPRAMLDGIQSIRVIYGSYSEHSKEKGVKMTTTRLETLSGAVYDLVNVDCVSGDVTPQPDYFGYYGGGNIPTMQEDIARHLADYDNVEIHGAKPK